MKLLLVLTAALALPLPGLFNCLSCFKTPTISTIEAIEDAKFARGMKGLDKKLAASQKLIEFNEKTIKRGNTEVDRLNSEIRGHLDKMNSFMAKPMGSSANL